MTSGWKLYSRAARPLKGEGRTGPVCHGRQRREQISAVAGIRSPDRFRFNGYSFPLEPKTVFYDWLYINAIYPHREWLQRPCKDAGFTDIEFNPSKSINCQARS